jgi:hypothetical protein
MKNEMGTGQIISTNLTTFACELIALNLFELLDNFTPPRRWLVGICWRRIGTVTAVASSFIFFCISFNLNLIF